MTDDAAETKRHLQRLAVERFIARRDVEWRLAFTLWASLGAFAVAIRDVRRVIAFFLFLVVGASAVLFHIAFQRFYVYKQMYRDWLIGLALDRELRDSITMEEGNELPDPPDVNSYRWPWAHAWQPAITLAIWGLTLLTIALNG